MDQVDNEEIIPGKSYTTFFVLRVPYPGDAFLRKWVIPTAIRSSGLSESYVIDSAGWWNPEKTLEFVPPISGRKIKVNGRIYPWTLFVQWRKRENLEEDIVLAGTVDIAKALGVVLLAAAALAIVFKFTFREVTATANGVADAFSKPLGMLLNPGVLVATVVVVALIWGARR